MNLRDLVGRMAIRTDKVREVMPWEMERAASAVEESCGCG